MNNPAQPRSLRSRRILWLTSALIVMFLVAAGGLYAWFFVYNPCEVEAVQEASAFLAGQLNTYDQVYQVATTAFRTSPDHPVNTLKQIFMDTQEVPVPACMRRAKNELINYMGAVIRAFQAYREGESDAAVVSLIRQSDEQYGNFQAELERVNQCAPYCLPVWKARSSSP
jgi:hypothetical protein